MNVGVAIHQSAARDRQAIAAFEGERSRTYAELDERTSRLANALRERFGVGKGDRVALLVHNRLEVVEVLGAVTKAAAIYCGLNFRLGESEYEAIFANATPSLVITEGEYLELAERLAAPHGIEVVDVDGEDYERLLAEASPEQPPTLHQMRPEDDFCIVYTSGTTGRPKGILFDVRSVIQHATVAITEYEMDPGSRWLMAIPHNSSVQITLLPLLLVGGAIGFSDSRGFDPGRFFVELRDRRATHTFLVPTMLYRVLEAGLTKDDVPELQTLGYGSSPIPPERVAELVVRFGPIFIQLYGMAEIASIGTMLRKSDHALAAADRKALFAAAGRPGHVVDVRVVDDDGHDVPVGERGEVIFGTPYTMKRYYNDPERTAEALVDGWMLSGDVGVFDEQGYLSIVDRKKDLIIRGGFNIAPSEVENVLAGHEAVLEVAVFGAPDEEWGEAVIAAVAFGGGRRAEPQELIDFCRRAGLPSIKVPERVMVLDELPKNAVGKIAKRELRESFATS
ncbi:MAG TPA: AMP-binding protein [Solirubrobacteraceae bacterium]|nr:AMP-binding protein [Solirubrobacteraceae bacterium]